MEIDHHRTPAGCEVRAMEPIREDPNKHEPGDIHKYDE